MDAQLFAVAGGPVLKFVLNFVMGKIPARFRPLIAPISGILIWVISGYATDMATKDILVNALLTSGGAVMTHETMKDTIQGGK